MKRCVRCVLPVTYPGLTFDPEGVCSRCLKQGAWQPRGHELLCSTVDRYRSKDTKYDCLVAFSGGRDSSYTLYYAVKVLGLKVLAFTIDNGFIPPQTHQNIRNATRILGVDHVVEKHGMVQDGIRPVLSAWLHRPSPAMISFLCTGCRLGLSRGFLHMARRYGIPLILSGMGEPVTSFATKLLSPQGVTGTRSLVSGLAREMVNNPRYLLGRPSYPYWLFMEYLYSGAMWGFFPIPILSSLVIPDMHHVKLFEFVRWDEQEIVSVIQSELGWQNYGHSESSWRSDCKISLFRNHLYYETLGYTKNDELISAMIRLGMMTREAGLARLERDNVVSGEFVQEFLAEVGVPYRQYQTALDRIRAAGPAAGGA